MAKMSDARVGAWWGLAAFFVAGLLWMLFILLFE